MIVGTHHVKLLVCRPKMATLVTDPDIEQRIQAEREATGADRFDEVWEGLYMMTPMPNIEHQQLVYELTKVLEDAIGETPLGIMPGVNISDREEGWKQNYRVPDITICLDDTTAKHCGTHLCGGADFLVEVVSPDDRSRRKFDFYYKLGVRELLLVDRDPWAIELYRNTGEALPSVGRSELDADETIKSEVLPLSFRIVDGDMRPRIEVRHDDGRTWLA